MSPKKSVVVLGDSDPYSRLKSRWRLEPAPNVGEDPVATRTGFDPKERIKPFIEDRLSHLSVYYRGYDTYFAEFVAYADVILLRDGAHGFGRGRDVSDIFLRPQSESFAPVASLRAHSNSAIDLFRLLGKQTKLPDGTYLNGLSVRFLNWPLETNKIDIQPASYESQIATNLTLDWASGKLGPGLPEATLRNTFEPPEDGRLRLLGRSRLANTLGVAAMVRSGDNQKLFTIRSAATAVMSERHRLHCSSSGVFEWKDLESNEKNIPFTQLFNGMRREITEELNLPEDGYTLVPLALARELPRGGKPQLFCVAECQLPMADIRQLMQSARDRVEWRNCDDPDLEPHIRSALNQPESIPVDQDNVEKHFTYEGWMAWSLFEAYDKRQSIFEQYLPGVTELTPPGTTA